jgi:hypothetical protein
MNKGRVSTQILLYCLMMLLLISGCSTTSDDDDFTVASSAPNAYSISGKVSGTTGVTINLTGASTTSVTTDTSTGAFTITGLASGKYTITPVKAGYIFTPSSVAVTVSGGTVTVPDFTATSNSAAQYSISGTVSEAVKYPVLITLSGDGSATTWTDVNGNYTFSNIVNGSYTVTPSLDGYTFAPASAPANVSGGNVTVPNFVSTADSITYSQTDLEGIWNMNILRKGTARNEWERFRLSVDNSGVASCIYYGNSTQVLTARDTLQNALTISATSFYVTNGTMPAGAVVVQIGDEKISGTFNASTKEITSCTRGYDGTTAAAHSAGDQVTEIRNNPTGETACPGSFDLTFAMAGGVVTPTGTTATDLGISHMTMTSGKNLIAGTGTSTDSSYQLAIMQKEARGTLSAALDASATSFYVNNLTMSSGSTIVQIDSEQISGTYNSVTQQFTNCTRGANSTTAAAHLQDAEVALVYSLADVQNKNFVYHQLQVGKINQWERAAGQTDAGGAIRLTSLTSPSGSAADMPKALGVTFVLNTATGRVDMSGTTYSSFQGFLSDDKKTIVGTFTDNITDSSAVDTGQNDYHLIVFQMDDQTYIADALPGTYVAHLLGIGSQIGWSYFTSTVASGGGMTFSGFNTSNGSFTVPSSTSGSISASGVVTITGISSYHGQMSYDGEFIVGTQTLASGVYALQIDTK